MSGGFASSVEYRVIDTTGVSSPPPCLSITETENVCLLCRSPCTLFHGKEFPRSSPCPASDPIQCRVSAGVENWKFRARYVIFRLEAFLPVARLRNGFPGARIGWEFVLLSRGVRLAVKLNEIVSFKRAGIRSFEWEYNYSISI